MRHLIFIILLFITTVNSQSIHQQQLEYYNQHFDPALLETSHDPIIPKQGRTLTPSRTIFGYHPYWMGTAWQNYNYNLLTTIAYFSAEATPQGNLSDLHGWPSTNLINMAHSHGVDVVLCITMFSSTDLTTLLSSATNRQNLINNIVNQVQAGNADGANIDFEVFPTSQKQNMITFISDLKAALTNVIPGAQVTLATPAVDWSNAWDYNALADISDGLFIMGYDYHYSGSSNTGANAPLTGGTYNVTWSVNDYLSETGGNGAKIILGVPYFGFEWPAASGNAGASTTGSGSALFYSTMEPLALSYGKLWDTGSQTPWYHYQSGGWFQGWYDDAASLDLKYDLALNNNLQGIGIWALGYDGARPELWETISENFGATTAPTTPSDLSAISLSATGILVSYSGANTADDVAVLQYDSNSQFIDTVGTFSQNPFTISWAGNGPPLYFRVVARNSFGTSPASEMMACNPSNDIQILIVNGFDRVNGTNNTFDFIRQHGAAIAQGGFGFDATTNDAVISGTIALDQYNIVDWILGEEGSATSTFTADEQAAVKTFLESGGNLFISGSEIGYDLWADGSTGDQQFYTDYLKAQYISDDAGGSSPVYSAFGVSGDILEVAGTFTFDNGSHGTYDVDWPDGIKPVGSATIIAKYSNVDYSVRGGAGIAYTGAFGNSNNDGAIVYLAVGFEAIYPEAKRNTIMDTVLNWFGAIETVKDPVSFPESFAIESIYPNPSNRGVTIQFNAAVPTQPTTLIIYDIKGRKIHETMLSPSYHPAFIYWNGNATSGNPVASGTYIARLTTPLVTQTKKFTILK